MDEEAFNSFVDKMEEEVPYDHGEDEEYEEEQDVEGDEIIEETGDEDGTMK